MLLIAAAFQNGLVVFHLGLPVLRDKSKSGFVPLPEPTQGTGLSVAPIISPLTARRWHGRNLSSSVSWLDLGPQNGLCLAVALHRSDSNGGGSNLIFGVLNSPLHTSPISSNRLAPFRVFASTSLAKDSNLLPTGLLRGAGILNLFSVSESMLMRVILVENGSYTSDHALNALSTAVSSQPSGLTASGEPLLSDTVSDKDGILHIFNVLQCERKVSKSDTTLLYWSPPLLRHWLVRTTSGDTKQTATSETKEDRGFGGSEKVAGGAASDVVCELYHDKLVDQVPCRIIRCLGSKICAIIYRAVLSAGTDRSADASLDATALAFIDCDGGRPEHIAQVMLARDVAFLPFAIHTSEPRGVLLSQDGSSATLFSWDSSSKGCKLASTFRPIVGVELSIDFIDCRRFFAFGGAGKVVFAAVGTRTRDECSCFVIGDLSEVETLTEENWSDHLPNVVEDRVFWFMEKEEILSVVGLEGDDSGYRNFAVSTSSRVLILSSALTVSAEAKAQCSGLAPLGPFAVSYTCKDKLHYLCCLDAELSSGMICTMPYRRFGGSQNHLLGLRPDRLLLLEHHSGTRFVEFGQNPNSFMLPTASTWPALFLEPLIANAVCVGGKQSMSAPILRTVIEKFGRKVASITHGDDEGIGQNGAGLTAKVFAILRKYGLTHASSWLLTGSVSFDRGANSKILPPWLPVASKATGSRNTDAFLHVVSNGDQYFSEYIKSPDHNMASTLPRQSDPTVYLSREAAYQAFVQGKSSNALTLLDLAGCDGMETISVQLALSLQRNGARDAMGFLKLVSGYDIDVYSGPPARASTSMAALAIFLKQRRSGDDELTARQIKRWMRPLAPSLQKGTHGGRARQKLAGEIDLAATAGKETDISDALWVSPCSEAKHVWYVMLHATEKIFWNAF
jgi:hypothetical protein